MADIHFPAPDTLILGVLTPLNTLSPLKPKLLNGGEKSAVTVSMLTRGVCENIPAGQCGRFSSTLLRDLVLSALSDRVQARLNKNDLPCRKATHNQASKRRKNFQTLTKRRWMLFWRGA